MVRVIGYQYMGTSAIIVDTASPPVDGVCCARTLLDLLIPLKCRFVQRYAN